MLFPRAFFFTYFLGSSSTRKFIPLALFPVERVQASNRVSENRLEILLKEMIGTRQSKSDTTRGPILSGIFRRHCFNEDRKDSFNHKDRYCLAILLSSFSSIE